MRDFDASRIPQPRIITPLPETSLPLDVEIGCGVGLHPIRYAQENPERFLAAIEHTSERFAKFAGRVANHESLPNLLPVHANAISWITHTLTPESVERYFLLYPNPYPKDKQRNQRWHAMPFMGFLLKTLKPGGELTLATNMEYYAQEAKQWMTGEWGLELVSELQPDAETFRARTHFEKKYLERGETCYDLRFRK